MRAWPRDLIVGLLPILIGLQVLLACIVLLPFGLRGYVDFRQLYSGGYILRTGHGSEMYDYETQQRIENAVVPVGQYYPLPINHPAFEELLFVPLSLLPYRTAYLLFLAFNGSLLVVCAWLLARIHGGSQRWLPLLLILSFYPVTRALMEGQDSILLLFLLTGAYWYFHRGNELAAGLLTGIGIFKFQIALPLALLFLIWRRWRFSAGFVVSAAASALLSFWLVGFEGAKQYGHMLISMSVRLAGKEDIFRYGTDPHAMLNLRGLVTAIFGGRLSHGGIQVLVIVASVVVLLTAARQRPSLPLAITAASLISYHFFAHDASVLIVPIMAALCTGTVWVASTAVLLLVASISTIILSHGYWGAIPLLLFYCAILKSPLGALAPFGIHLQRKQAPCEPAAALAERTVSS